MARVRSIRIKKSSNDDLEPIKWRSIGGQFNDGDDELAKQFDAETARQWATEQAQDGTERSVQLEAILDVINRGGFTELTPIQQKVFQLCVVENMEQAVAANQLSMTQQAVSDHLSQACKTLRELAEIRLKELVQETPQLTKETIRKIAKKSSKKPK